MTLSFADAPGNLFNQLGRLGKLLDEMDAYQAAQLGNFKDNADNASVQFESEPDVQAILGSAYIGALNTPGGVGGLCQAVAAAAVNRQVFRDNPQYNLTLTQTNTVTSVLEVIRQMRQQGATVLAMTVAATPALFAANNANGGNGVVVASVRRPSDGLVLENAFAETVKVVCTADSFTGGAAEGNEGFTALGVGQQADPFAFDWPLGSNGQADLDAIDGTSSVSAGNLLTNSGWDDWTGGEPDNWDLVVGSSLVTEDTGIVFTGGSSLKITGDGSTLVQFRQQFNDSGGTTSELEAATQYAVNVWARRDGVAPAAGVLAVELVDGNGNVVNDQAGTANRFTIDLTALTVFYAAFNGAFRLPDEVPDELYLQFRMTAGNALTSGRAVYLDTCGLGEMSQLYTGGPYLAVFSGGEPFVAGDFTTVAVTNSRGSGGSLSTFQTLADRLLGLRELDILLPSSSSPTISDSLITR